MKITRSAAEAIKAHGVEGFPYEICGLLAGHADREVITESRRLTNVAKRNKRRRYSVDGLEDMKVQKAIRADGLDVMGYYHSHPNHPAQASETDAGLAWTSYVYAIVSIHEREPGELNAFIALKDHGPMKQIDLEVI